MPIREILIRRPIILCVLPSLEPTARNTLKNESEFEKERRSVAACLHLFTHPGESMYSNIRVRARRPISGSPGA